jgi:dihydropteroate synthase
VAQQKKAKSALARQWLCRDQRLTFSDPLIMGVMNITPDSFSDGGNFLNQHDVMLDRVLSAGQQMVDEGAHILDVGGESSRPGAEPIGDQEEIRRVIPVIKALTELDALISVDTYHVATARAAVEAGAHIINDISGGADAAMLKLIANSGVGVCLMHMQGTPETMQDSPTYDDVIADVTAFLSQRVQASIAAGVRPEQIAIDPGFGFGKTLQHNLLLLRHLQQVRVGEHPLLVGLSRKSMLGKITGRPVEDRDAASVAAAVIAMQNGADVIRVHDVGKTMDGLQVFKHVTSAT